MSIIVLPTNVKLPTLLDDLRARYVDDEIDLETFERDLSNLMASGREDEVSPAYGMQTALEWR